MVDESYMGKHCCYYYMAAVVVVAMTFVLVVDVYDFAWISIDTSVLGKH